MDFASRSLGPALHYVALIALIGFTLVACGVVVELAALPGRIARRRGHPQAAAINICGWVGLPTGFFWIVALVWAFVRQGGAVSAAGADGSSINTLVDQISRLEATVTRLEQQQRKAGT